MSTGTSLDDVRVLLKNVRGKGKQLSARCPAHDDKCNSLSVTSAENGRILFHCHAGCSHESVFAALGINMKKASTTQRKILARYSYCDESGKELYQTVRYEPKDFRQRRLNENGKYEWNLNGVRRVLYHLPELLAADNQSTLIIVEGEKDVERLRSEGLLATTCMGGAGKWREEYSECLSGRRVAIVPDNDTAGYKHAEQVARSIQGIADKVKIVSLFDLPEKGDVSDFLNLGGTVDELLTLIEAAPEWKLVEGTEDSRHTAENTPMRKQSQGARLIELVSDTELFHTPDGKTYATVRVDNHDETMLLNSRSFRELLSHRFYLSDSKAPSTQGMQDALNVLNGKARFEGEEQKVHVRIGQDADTIYIDLCDKDRRIIKVSAAGYLIIEAHDCPIKFRRTRGMLPLPEPKRGSKMDLLKRFINIALADFILVVMWLVAALRQGRPFPILALHGEQGSAKSTTARILRAIIDPNTAALRSEPRSVHDLMIAATNSWCICFDNLSVIPAWLSDALCRLATGGGFATRELYANDEEVLFDAMRPVILTSIEELATRSDLLDRAVIVYLPVIPEALRRTESKLWAEFEVVHAEILGALLEGISIALSKIGSVKLPRLPRMADFAEWAVAAEEGLGFEPGSFMDAYEDNRKSANTLALEASPVSAVVFAFIVKHDKCWMGTATQLLQSLNVFADEALRRQPTWPRSPKVLSSALRRLAPNLRAIGVAVTFSRESGTGRRLVELERVYHSSSQSSHASQDAKKATQGVPICDDGNNSNIKSSHLSSPLNAHENEAYDNRDDYDDEMQGFSDDYDKAERLAIMSEHEKLAEDVDRAAEGMFDQTINSL